MPDLHHSDIITYALSRLAANYARENQEILRDLRNYRAAESPASRRMGGQELPSPLQGTKAAIPPPKPPPGL